MPHPTHTILIVEDDPFLREAYLRRFKRTRFAVRTANDGAEAVQMIRQCPPDLLLCDVMLPQHDGWWVLEQCPRPPRTFPVIMLTNLADAASRQRGDALGADSYFVKAGMSLHALVEMAERLLPQRDASLAA